MDIQDAGIRAYGILCDDEVAARLGIDRRRAARLGLALVTAADLAPRLAAEFISVYGATIEDLELCERYTTSRPCHDESGIAWTCDLSAGTRRCLDLLHALKLIANSEPSTAAAA